MFKFVNKRVRIDIIGSLLPKSHGYICLSNIQVRNMTTRHFRIKKDKPSPYPYETKTYNSFRSIFDKTLSRFDENTKLIVIEGPVASGKHKLAKAVAEEFEMKYVPDITSDALWINYYGYDMRNLDPKLPENAQSFDEKRFNLDPFHRSVAAFQEAKYWLRYHQYWDDITHILNTGQGVVTVRSPFSDAVIMEALRACNYISPQAKTSYNQLVRHTIQFLFRPHLIIYLDVPVNVTINNIKKRNIPHEVNSKALTPKFIQSMENYYKKYYLLESSVHSKMLIYNWVEEGDSEVVIEDIERVDFDKHTHPDDLKLLDWRMEEMFLDAERVRFSSQKMEHMQYFNTVECYDAPENKMSGNDFEVLEKVWNSAPGMEYSKGYNYLRGDKNIWRKTKKYHDFDMFRI